MRQSPSKIDIRFRKEKAGTNHSSIETSRALHHRNADVRLVLSKENDVDLARAGGRQAGTGVMNISQPFIERPVAMD